MFGQKVEVKFPVKTSSYGWYYDIVLSYQQDSDEGVTRVTIERGELRKEKYKTDYNQGTVNVGVKLNGVEYLTNKITNSDKGKYITEHIINKYVDYKCNDDGSTPPVNVECMVSFSSSSAYNPNQRTYKSVGTITIPNMEVGQKGYIKINGSIREVTKMFIKTGGVLKQVKGARHG